MPAADCVALGRGTSGASAPGRRRSPREWREALQARGIRPAAASRQRQVRGPMWRRTRRGRTPMRVGWSGRKSSIRHCDGLNTVGGSGGDRTDGRFQARRPSTSRMTRIADRRELTASPRIRSNSIGGKNAHRGCGVADRGGGQTSRSAPMVIRTGLASSAQFRFVPISHIMSSQILHIASDESMGRPYRPHRPPRRNAWSDWVDA